MPRRSLLFVPGDQPDLHYKAINTGADGIIIDLEDAVLPNNKDAAGKATNNVLTDPEFIPECEVIVRINSFPRGKTDFELLFDNNPPIDAILVPKVDNTADVNRVVKSLSQYQSDIPVFALCETPSGILNAKSIAIHSHVTAIIFGAEDLTAAIGATRTKDFREVSYARQHVLLAARAASIDAIDTVTPSISDIQALKCDTKTAIEFGFDGKVAIHPDQVSIINDMFTPTPQEVQWAKTIMKARNQAEADKKGVFVVDGEMIDEPLIVRATRILDRANYND